MLGTYDTRTAGHRQGRLPALEGGEGFMEEEVLEGRSSHKHRLSPQRQATSQHLPQALSPVALPK